MTERPVGDHVARAEAVANKRPHPIKPKIFDTADAGIDAAREQLRIDTERDTAARIAAKNHGVSQRPPDSALDAYQMGEDAARAVNRLIDQAQTLREQARLAGKGYLTGHDPRLGSLDEALMAVAGCDLALRSIARDLVALANAQKHEDPRSRGEFFRDVYLPAAEAEAGERAA